MARRRRAAETGGGAPPPIPLEPVDLLAGLAPGVELCADDVPAGLDPDTPAGTTTVAEAGRHLRSGDATIRRLIRSEVLPPAPGGRSRTERTRDRAGVVPSTRRRPGE